jgi:uncharacterized membrane protein SirB2
MKATGEPIAYTATEDGRVIIPMTFGALGIMIGIGVFAVVNMFIVWAFWAIHPVWGVIAYKVLGLLALYVWWFRRKMRSYARGR